MKVFRFGDIGNVKKGNHPGEAYVRRGPRKALHRREGEMDSLEGPHEEEKIQRKALR